MPLRFTSKLAFLPAFALLCAPIGVQASPPTPVAGYGPQHARYAHGAVASAEPIASQVGVDILKRGGNAVDAAVAVGLALAVTYPEAGNLGGGGFMLIRLADGRCTAIDYRETAPLGATEKMYQDAQGNLVPDASQVGYRSGGVPGTVAGFALAQGRYGKLKWADVVAPALKLATDGFVVNGSMASALKNAKGLAHFEESRRIFQRNGNFYAEGETLKQPDLAATLRRLKERGPREFYEGETARRIAGDMAAHGGLVTLADLKTYQAVERTPLRGTYRGYDILTMPPPSSGGAVLLEILNQLEGYDLAALGYGSSSSDHLLLEAMRRGFADRADLMGDPDFVKVPVAGLISKAYAKTRAATIDGEKATPSASMGAGDPAPYESPQTTHYSIVDADGNAVSNTYTLNFSFGSGVTLAGTGILLNDEMDDFAAKPGTPNGFGLVQGARNAIAPRKRPLSSMTPTILTRNGKLSLVIGSPGGPTIITTVLQTVVNIVDYGMTLPQAIAAPRLHQQWLPDVVNTERFGMTADVRAALIARGYSIPERGGFGGGNSWGNAQGILIDPESGVRIGASDPRRDGAVAGY